MTSSAIEETPPLKPNMTILEDRWLHHVMVFFSSFDERPTWFNWLVLLGVVGIYLAVASLVVPVVALSLAVILFGFMLLDIGLLWILPRVGVSFGAVPAPLILLSMPRLAVAGLSLLLAIFQPWSAVWLMLILQIAGLTVYLWSSLIEPYQLSLTQLQIQTSTLKSDAPPIRMLHLSDLHLERLTKRENHVLDLIAQAKPDLIVITGDYLNLSYNRDPEAIDQVRAFLPKIKAPFGVYATLGSPPVDVWDVAPFHFKDTDIRLLRNETVDLDLGQGRQLTLIGMDCTHDMTYDVYQLEKQFETPLPQVPRVLLYHSPELMPDACKKDIDLFLCGHTHGGQVRLPFYGAILTSSCTGKRYEMGRYDEQGTTLYVSRGIGLEGMSAPRIRLFCPPEITLVTLQGRAEH
ncbi:MAG: metallophosphoesterase [Chloroflexota bacterium]